MKFIKDLLLFEVMATGPDTDKDNIIQLSAVLLDKDNLLEKAFFNSYVRVSYLDSFIHEHAKLLGIDPEVYRKSPKIYDAIKKFHRELGTNLLLCTHGTNNILYLKQAFRKTGISFDYNTHILDLWTLGYIYSLHYGIKKMPSFTTFAEIFHQKLKNPKNALEKVRLQAEIFKKMIKET